MNAMLARKRLWSVIGAVVLISGTLGRAQPTLANSLDPSNTTPTGKAFEFRGVKVGDTAAMHTSRWGSPIRGYPACNRGDRWGIIITHCTFSDRTVSGMRGTLSASFVTNGELLRLGGLFDAAAFSVLYDALAMKYGNPSNTDIRKLRNGLGQERAFPIARWYFDDGEMSFEVSPNDGGKYSELEFKTNSVLAREKALRPKPKVDF